MTHEELLENVTKGNFSSTRENLALRAVVELHKPEAAAIYQKLTDGYLEIVKSRFQCLTCYGTYPRLDGAYPCPTIQAIEKELA